jgi:hypothetical protein
MIVAAEDPYKILLDQLFRVTHYHLCSHPVWDVVFASLPRYGSRQSDANQIIRFWHHVQRVPASRGSLVAKDATGAVDDRERAHRSIFAWKFTTTIRLSGRRTDFRCPATYSEWSSRSTASKRITRRRIISSRDHIICPYGRLRLILNLLNRLIFTARLI